MSAATAPELLAVAVERRPAAPAVSEASPRGRVAARLGSLPRSVRVALLFHLVCGLALLPVAGQPYDLAALTGHADAWLRWGFPLGYGWKFGFDLTLMGFGAEGLRTLLQAAGMSGAAAITTAWKLPLLAADLATGALLFDLGRRLRARHPARVAVLFLVSPVSLWVAAGHGQVEPLAILAIVLACDLVARERYLAAGAVVGLGAGAEYLPLLLAGAAVLFLLFGALPRRRLLAFEAGALGTTLLCFLPALGSAAGRAGLVGGVVGTARASYLRGTRAESVARAGSIWHLAGVSPGWRWLIAAAAVAAAVATAAAWRARGRDHRDATSSLVAAAGGVLTMLVLLDPTPLPQFADLVLGGLCLMALVLPLPSPAVLASPLLLVTRGWLFLGGGATFASYWWDMWAKTGNSGWHAPRAAEAVVWCETAGVVIVPAALLAAGLATLRKRRGTGHGERKLSWLPALAGAAVCAAIAAWSLQPAYWSQVGRSGPKQLADWSAITARRPAKVTGSAGEAPVVRVSRHLLAAAREARVPPSEVVGASARALYAAGGLRGSVKVTPHLVESVVVHHWSQEAPAVSSVWVTLLASRPARSGTGMARAVLPRLLTGREGIDPRVDRSTSPGWSLLSYRVPARQVEPSGRLTFRLTAPPGERLRWNPIGRRAWAVVSIARAQVTLDTGAGLSERTAWFPPPVVGALKARVGFFTLPLRGRTRISRLAIGARPIVLKSGALEWPTTTPLASGLSNSLLDLCGVAYLLCCGLALLALRKCRPPSSAEGSALGPELSVT